MFAPVARALLLTLSFGGMAALGVAAHRVHRAELGPDEVAEGVRIEGELVGEANARTIALERASRVLDRPLRVVLDGRELFDASLRELGGTADVERVTRDALAIGRRGDWLARHLDRERASAGAYALGLRYELPVEAVAALVAPARDTVDARPQGARRSARSGAVTPHREGRLVDAYATAEALLRAARDLDGDGVVELSTYAWLPAATTELAERADTKTVLARFETRFGGPAGRDKNILRAATTLDGVVLAPGDSMSFNDLVGPRTTDNGFFPAPEIFRGEMREGIGGGSCQVASTLYAAALFAGLEILERRNHSRPSGYIRPGLDATVAYPVLDLRLRNGFDFPVVVAASPEPGLLAFEIRGAERPATVSLATETLGVLEYGRKLEKTRLPSGEFKLKQKGKRGLRVKRITTSSRTDGSVHTEESVDVYPPVQEIWLVAPDTDPALLPPLEEGARETASL